MRAVWAGRRSLQAPLRQRSKRLRFGRHRVAALPHHCRPQGFPLPPCPAPGNRTRGGGRRHQGRRDLPGSERIKIMTSKSTQTTAKTRPSPPPPAAAGPPVRHLRAGRPPRPASGPGRQPRPHLRPRTRRLRRHPRRDRGAHRPRRQGVRDGAEREGHADPPATDHRRLRRLRLRGRPVLRHQEVGRDGPHQQAAQRRPRRGPRRSGRLREQGRARPPVRRRDGACSPSP